jgi:hypothetical protein
VTIFFKVGTLTFSSFFSLSFFFSLRTIQAVFHHIHILPYAVVMASILVEHMTCIHREAVLQSKEFIMASVSEHIQNEFAKWQEQQRQRDVISTVSSRMVWFDFLTFRTLMEVVLILMKFYFGPIIITHSESLIEFWVTCSFLLNF